MQKWSKAVVLVLLLLVGAMTLRNMTVASATVAHTGGPVPPLPWVAHTGGPVPPLPWHTGGPVPPLPWHTGGPVPPLPWSR